MKFGFRTPSLNRRIAARTSWKRYVRHSVGLKAPRGMGIITNPQKAMYNRVYNRTTFGIGDIVKTGNTHTAKNVGTKTTSDLVLQTSSPVEYDQPFILQPDSFIQILNAKEKTGKDTKIGFILIAGFVLLFLMPPMGIILLIVGLYLSFKLSKKPWYQEKQALTKAKKAIKANNFDTAIAFLKDAYTINENNPITNYLFGTVLTMTGRFDESLKYLKKYSKTNPADLDAKLVLAYSYYNLKRFKEAAVLLQQFPSDNPNCLLVILLLGDSFLQLKQYDPAIEVFNRGPLRKTNLDTYLIQLHYLLGVAYKEKGNRQKALNQFQKVYSVDMKYRDVEKEMSSLTATKTK